MMSTTQTEVLQTMRAMAWERAKGEMRSILCTYWDEAENFSALHDEIGIFIKKVEGNGLLEQEQQP